MRARVAASVVLVVVVVVVVPVVGCAVATAGAALVAVFAVLAEIGALAWVLVTVDGDSATDSRRSACTMLPAEDAAPLAPICRYAAPARRLAAVPAAMPSLTRPYRDAAI